MWKKGGGRGNVAAEKEIPLSVLLFCSSKEWQDVPDREKRRMGLVVADDGEFW